MLVMRYTGKGWLAFILFITVGVGCAMLTAITGLRDDAFAITFAALYTLIGMPLHWRIGTAINAPARAGRSDPHFFGHAPMEYWAVFYPTIAMVIVAILFAKNGSTFGAWAVGIGTLIGLIVLGGWGKRHWDRTNNITGPATPEGHFLYGPPPGEAVLPTSRHRLAALRGWRYQAYAPEVRDRWRDGYGAEADAIAPVEVMAGELEGFPFTVFDTKENIGSFSQRRDSHRTVCVLHLPVSLPDVRLRGRLADEEMLVGQIPPVAAEPPWNCDLLPRAGALALIESGEQTPPMVAESDLPGFADELITEDVRLQTLRHRVPGWRIHGRDLVFVSIPGPGTSMSTHEVTAVVAGLAAIARTLPAHVLHRYGQPPTTDVPLADATTTRA